MIPKTATTSNRNRGSRARRALARTGGRATAHEPRSVSLPLSNSTEPRAPWTREHARLAHFAHYGPVQWTSRTAGEDMTFGGQTIRRDEVVLASVGSANRDERFFPDPDRLDVRRPDNKHLAFGSGPHFCLGAALARMEGETAIRTLLARFPNIRLERQKLRWHTGLTFRGVKSLWLGLK